MSNDIFAALAAEFPREAISWRAQNIKKDGSSALALAYIDARDVMDRLDEVVGPANWQDRYEVHGGKTICYLSIAVDDEPDEHGVIHKHWITKADGAGDSDIEAEKGAISDAFKRAAVRWQIGRYLYAMPATWVPCDAYETEFNGKKKWNWRKWLADPWDHVKLTAKPHRGESGQIVEIPTTAAQGHWTVIAEALSACTTTTQLNGAWSRHEPVYSLFPDHFKQELKNHYLEIRDILAKTPGVNPSKTATPPSRPDPFGLDKLQVELTHEQKIAGTP